MTSSQTGLPVQGSLLVRDLRITAYACEQRQWRLHQMMLVTDVCTSNCQNEARTAAKGVHDMKAC